MSNMEPYFSDSEDQQIFLNYHPPSRGDGMMLTVICAPLFTEAMRTQRVLRDLAVRIVEHGHHVLRFDYRGTGDSFGKLSTLSLSDWSNDVAFAVREGLDVSGARAVNLVAVRAAALIVARAAAGIVPISRLVFWDPVVDGREYLDSLRRVRQSVLQRNTYLKPEDRQSAASEIGGCVLSPSLLDEIDTVSAADVGSIPSEICHVVHSTSIGPTALPGVRQHALDMTYDWETDSEDLIHSQQVQEMLERCLTTA